jgi:uncharacterized membrane protein
MGTHRMEMFSDGVLAIIITIMVLQVQIPDHPSLESLAPLVPVLLSYVLSFLYIGISWVTHHHLLHTCEKVTGRILWANLHVLFWLSLLPFATAWMGENHFSTTPSMVYGIVLLLASCAFWLLQQAIMNSQGESSLLRKAIGSDRKGNLTLAALLAGILVTFWSAHLAQLIYAAIALTWIAPDKRIEKAIRERAEEKRESIG